MSNKVEGDVVLAFGKISSNRFIAGGSGKVASMCKYTRKLGQDPRRPESAEVKCQAI